ncbi:hypothetical protein D9615_006797 [Tricholomella constricta]|uniref:Uncharacterized protein n=1 Tax=Tricholomella constricta TaxID=117010 RepID=A0A8H5H7R6_9AGAR|nr:hypothetical protein D9615_006797 [Tricholomella constricta]
MSWVSEATYITLDHGLDQSAKYTSALTLAATAIASLGLLSLLLILAYEYWFAPIVIRKAPEKRGSKLQSNIPQPIVSPTLEKTNTLSSGYSDLSSSSSTTVVSRPARLIRAFNHIFRGGSPAPPPAADQEQGVDDAPALESLEITPQLLATEEGARQRWIQTAGKISSMVPVTKLLWEKVPQGVPRMTVDHQTLPPSRPMIRTDSSSVPQTSREPPDRVIPLRHGALQDLEYSPNKRLLAITKYDNLTFGIHLAEMTRTVATTAFLSNLPR